WRRGLPGSCDSADRVFLHRGRAEPGLGIGVNPCEAPRSPFRYRRFARMRPLRPPLRRGSLCDLTRISPPAADLADVPGVAKRGAHAYLCRDELLAQYQPARGRFRFVVLMARADAPSVAGG